MATIEKTIDIDVPVRTAYNQWTQFEEFPQFMAGVKEVRQIDDQHLHWRAEVLGKDVEWDAEITRQIPDRSISWHSTSGAKNSGTVAFQSIEPEKTRLTMTIDYEPEGVAETSGSGLGMVSMRVEGDLRRFKEFIEERGFETGQWRGEIPGSGTAGATNLPS
jgi:uncharacterized membrane protein